ncbi:hypothetical protein D3C75_761900 [compost metagenome]
MVQNHLMQLWKFRQIGIERQVQVRAHVIQRHSCFFEAGNQLHGLNITVAVDTVAVSLALCPGEQANLFIIPDGILRYSR